MTVFFLSTLRQFNGIVSLFSFRLLRCHVFELPAVQLNITPHVNISCHVILWTADYIRLLLIMEDDLDDNNLEPNTSTTSTVASSLTAEVTQTATPTANPAPPPSTVVIDWCVCGMCRTMSQAIENKCC